MNISIRPVNRDTFSILIKTSEINFEKQISLLWQKYTNIWNSKHIQDVLQRALLHVMCYYTDELRENIYRDVALLVTSEVDFILSILNGISYFLFVFQFYISQFYIHIFISIPYQDICRFAKTNKKQALIQRYMQNVTFRLHKWRFL